ncbi:hypothetical protein ABFS83_09G025400 [Erythranthe nasuta]
MQRNLQMEGGVNGGGGGSEQPTTSDDGQFLVDFRKMVKKEIEVMVIRTVHQVIGPIVEDLIRKVLKEEIQLAVEKAMLSTNGVRNSSNETSLQLKILDKVAGPVLTGKSIMGNEGTPIRVALVDKTTGEVIKSGPGCSAKVEILVLDSSGDNNEHRDNWSIEDFNNKIIREGDKTKPHFARSNYVYLEEGVAVLRDVKLGHDSSWMKSCECRLGLRIAESFRGVKVEEARSSSFMVLDSRSKLYGNHYPPSLSDEVWRLENIGKDGTRCNQLYNNKILKVKDFLFLHSINPQRLQEILGVGDKTWKSTVDHARTCILDDGSIYVYYPSEFKTGVAFDAVGGLKGAIHDSHYVPITDLSTDEKDCARSLLLVAFENGKDIISFPDETSLQHQYPSKYSDLDCLSDFFRGIEHFETLFSPESNNILCGAHSEPHRQSKGGGGLDGVAAIVIRMVRARKRFMALGGMHLQKRQRI